MTEPTTEKIDDEIDARKERINELLDISGYGGDYKKHLIDIFDEGTEIVISIRQDRRHIGEITDDIDIISLNVNIDDFDGVDLEDEFAADEVSDIFTDIMTNRLKKESIYL